VAFSAGCVSDSRTATRPRGDTNDLHPAGRARAGLILERYRSEMTSDEAAAFERAWRDDELRQRLQPSRPLTRRSAMPPAAVLAPREAADRAGAKDARHPAPVLGLAGARPALAASLCFSCSWVPAARPATRSRRYQGLEPTLRSSANSSGQRTVRTAPPRARAISSASATAPRAQLGRDSLRSTAACRHAASAGKACAPRPVHGVPGAPGISRTSSTCPAVGAVLPGRGSAPFDATRSSRRQAVRRLAPRVRRRRCRPHGLKQSSVLLIK